MAAEPHAAGSPQSRAVADYLAATLKEWGLQAQIEEFEALLPYPTQRSLEMVAPVRYRAKLQEPVVSEDVVVNPNSTLKNVIVYIKEGLGTKTFPPPTQPAVLNQNGCMFEPHVLPILVGQELQIVNSDSTFHNVHSMSKANLGFNVAQTGKGMKLSKKFSSPEVFEIKCDVHQWMHSYVAVLTNPYYSVTGSDGSFTIKNLPAGDYTIEAWQEKLGPQPAKVTVGATGSSTVDFTFKSHS